jgi:NADH-quinone oxidoreductase subunit J
VGEEVLFWILAPISVVSAGAMVLQRNAVHAALLLIVNFFTLAVLFLLLGSEFLFVVQIIVYAGAIMVLFLFVVMLLGVDRKESLTEQLAGQRWLATLLGLGLVAEVVVAVRLGIGLSSGRLPDFSRVNAGGNVHALAAVLFDRYFFPFEVTSALLIIAAIGVVLHGRRQEPAAFEDDATPAGIAVVQPEPGPGGETTPVGAP